MIKTVLTKKRRVDLGSILTAFFLLFLLLPSTVHSQIVINELGVLSSPDWVEIYNYDEQPVDLSVYKIIDNKGNELTLSRVIQSEGFEIFTWSNRLDNSGDILKLIDTSTGVESVIETIMYGDFGGVCIPDNSDGSIGKTIDGGNVIVRYSISSYKLSNEQGTTLVCPTPTPEPTRTPTPEPKQVQENTSTPPPTPSPTIYATKKPIIKPTPTPKKTLKPSPSQSSDDDNVLGVSELENTSEPTPKEDKDDDKKPVPILPVLFIVTGLAFIVGAVLYYFKTTGIWFKMKTGDKGKETEIKK